MHTKEKPHEKTAELRSARLQATGRVAGCSLLPVPQSSGGHGRGLVCGSRCMCAQTAAVRWPPSRHGHANGPTRPIDTRVTACGPVAEHPRAHLAAPLFAPQPRTARADDRLESSAGLAHSSSLRVSERSCVHVHTTHARVQETRAAAIELQPTEQPPLIHCVEGTRKWVRRARIR